MVFRRLGRQFRSLLSKEQNLEERLQQHRKDQSPLVAEEEELYLQLEPITASLEEAKTAARGGHYGEASRALLEHFHDRIRPYCFLHHGDVDHLVEHLRPYAADCRRQVKACETILQHRFSPLGCEPYHFPQAIDWFSDFAGQSWLYAHSEILREQYHNPATSATDATVRQQPGFIELTWSFNELSHFLELARAYWISGNESLASEFIVEAVDWGERNPPLFGVNWISSKSIAARSLNWMLSTLMFLSSPQLQGEVFTRLLRTLLWHGAIMANLLEQGTTHRLAVASSLYLLASHIPEFTAAKRWQAIAKAQLGQAVEETFSADGFHRSGATAAHREALEWLLLCQTFNHLNSRSHETLDRPLELAAEALVYLKPAHGPFQDLGANYGEGFLRHQATPTEHTHRLLALSAVLLHREDLAYVSGDCPGELLWWLGPTAVQRYQSLAKTEPKGVRRLFRDAGIAVCRDHWGMRSSWCCFKGLKMTPSPSQGQQYLPQPPTPLPWHDDALSLSLVLDGENVLLEPGVPASPGDLTEVFSRLVSHSSVRIGREMEPVSLAPEASDVQVATTLESHRDGYLMAAERPVWLFPERPFLLRREVLFMPKQQRLVLRDQFQGEGEIHYESNLQLAPHLDVLMRGDMGCLLRGKKLQARIIPLFPGRFRYEMLKGRTSPFGGWMWSEGARLGPATLLRYYARLPAPLTITLWIAWNPQDTLTPRQQDVERLFR